MNLNEGFAFFHHKMNLFQFFLIAGNSTIVNQPSLFYPPQKSGFHEDLLRDNVERQYSLLFISVSKVYKYIHVSIRIYSKSAWPRAHRIHAYYLRFYTYTVLIRKHTQTQHTVFI